MPLELPEGLLNCDARSEPSADISARRLGIQFEQLVKIGLRTNPQVIDIESNIPIRDGKITVGEADLLLRFGDAWWHLELALKFYLREIGTEGLQGYYGPNRKDRFDIKWQHMLAHQTQIFSQPAAQSLLESRGIEQLNSACLIKGWVFQHPNDPRNSYPDPISPHHARGWWVRQSELNAWLGTHPAAARFMIVEKPFWLYPPSRITGRALQRDQLEGELIKRQGAVQVWVVIGEGYSRQVLSRGYVVHDLWGLDGD